VRDQLSMQGSAERLRTSGDTGFAYVVKEAVTHR
jgi:hypothetical protein